MIGPGTELAGCVIERELGRGGMGVVYLARHVALDRPVALKVLAATAAGDADWLARFRREARAQAAVEHPHIVPVHDAGSSPEGPYLVMRFVDGQTLFDVLRAGAGPRLAVGLCAQIAEALEALHARGLVHRDVKPQNVLIERGDHAWLGDFGLGRTTEATSVTRSGAVVGTPSFLSPEAIEGGEVGPASDVYALAATLYQCVAGQPPFAGRSDMAVLMGHLNEDPAAPSSLRAGLPAAVDEAVLRGMDKDPARRPAPGELVASVMAALGDETPTVIDAVPPAAQQDPTPVTASPRERRRGLWRAAGGAAVVVAAAAGSVTSLALGGDSGAAADLVGRGGVQVEVPAGWAAAAGAPVAGLRQAFALAPGGDVSRGALVVGQAAPRAGAVLPGGFRATSSTVVEPLRLGDVEIRRAAGVRMEGVAPPVDLYLGTTKDTLVVAACVPAAGRSAAPADACDRALSTLSGPDLRAPGADPDFAREVGDALRRFSTRRAAAVRDMSATKKRTTYAKRAAAVGTAAKEAAAAMGAITSPGAYEAATLAAIRKALGTVAETWTTLATAAASRHSTARGRVGRAEDDLARAVGGLARIGYAAPRNS